MSYLIILFGIGLLLVAYFVSSRKQRRQEKQKQLENSWAKPKDEYFNFDLISRYASLPDTNSANRLSTQTLTDIDFKEVFKYIDRTHSKPGQQFLYHHLLNPRNNISSLQELKRKADFFNQNITIRKDTRFILSALNDYDAYQICSLLESKTLKRPKWFRWVYADLALILLMVILGFFFPILWILLVFIFGLNLVLHFWNKRNILQYGRALPQLSLLIATCTRLTGKDIPLHKETAQKHMARLSQFKKKIKWIDFGQKGLKGDFAEAFQYFYEIVKAFLLIEFRALFSITKELEDKKADIKGLFDFVGQTELALTIASLNDSGCQLCTPAFSTGTKNMKIRQIYHPLIPDCVVNDLSLKGKSILITGSNMSGKTTFLRTIAINAILAQTLYLCFAESYAAPTLQVHSSIRADDNLMTGDSYYMAEVAVISDLIKAAGSQTQNLFVLDEIFKGTNTIERIASVKAILSFLNAGENIVLVATHDMELVAMLKSEYELYCFEETICNGQISFDHKLKSGQLHEGNAIRILKICHYPPSVIKEAQTIATKLYHTKENFTATIWAEKKKT